MIYSVSFSWKITQIIDEGVAMSFKNQFNNYIHCKKKPRQSPSLPFYFPMEVQSLEIPCS